MTGVKILHALHPDTVVRWHRQGFRLYWRWRSRGAKPGRPAIDDALRKLIREMQAANIGWGAPRIHGELLKLGIDVSQATVSKYMLHLKKPPSQTWRTFLNNHAEVLGSNGLLYSSHSWVSSALCVCCAQSRPPTSRSFQCDRAPDCQMDSATTCRSLSIRFSSAFSVCVIGMPFMETGYGAGLSGWESTRL